MCACDAEPEYLDQFTLVIGTQLDEATIALLGELCLAKRLPLLLVHAHGLLGSFRLQTTQHAILDAKHDPPLHELLLAKPFPALEVFVDSFDLDALSSIDHAHVPFVVILLKAARAWRAAHDDQLPRFVRSLSVICYVSISFFARCCCCCLLEPAHSRIKPHSSNSFSPWRTDLLDTK